MDHFAEKPTDWADCGQGSFVHPAQRKLFIQIMSISQKRRFWTCRILWTTLFNSLLFKIFQMARLRYEKEQRIHVLLFYCQDSIHGRAFSAQSWMFGSRRVDTQSQMLGRVDECSTARFCFWHRGRSSCEFLELQQKLYINIQWHRHPECE